jgi:hypothetical protein
MKVRYETIVSLLPSEIQSLGAQHAAPHPNDDHASLGELVARP